MLNRRILRIKAMQVLYAYIKSQEVNHQIALDSIAEKFKNKLNIIGFEHREILNQEEKKAIKLFEKYYTKTSVDAQEQHNQEVRAIVDEVIKSYRKACYKDFEQISKHPLEKIENIYHDYIKILSLVVDLAEFTDKTKLKPVAKDALNKLPNNTLIKIIRKRIAPRRKNNQWDNRQLSQWFKLFYKDPNLLTLLRATDSSFDKDKAVVRHLLRNVIFKQEQILIYFEERDIYWEENKNILKDVVSKTIEGIVEEYCEILLPLSKYWQEDKVFFKDLVLHTIDLLPECEKIVGTQIKTWSLERIAAVDKVILYMAICEMIHFSNIPVKVTINEYIEVAKLYSTPKSAGFINGTIDIISQKLKDNNRVKKTARGLLDNK